MEATKASEAMKVALRSNMYMDSRAIEVASFKSEVIFIALMPADLWGHCPLVRYLLEWDGPLRSSRHPSRALKVTSSRGTLRFCALSGTEC